MCHGSDSINVTGKIWEVSSQHSSSSSPGIKYAYTRKLAKHVIIAGGHVKPNVLCTYVLLEDQPLNANLSLIKQHVCCLLCWF